MRTRRTSRASKTAVDLILETPGLGDADRSAILGATATRLLGIKP